VRVVHEKVVRPLSGFIFSEFGGDTGIATPRDRWQAMQGMPVTERLFLFHLVLTTALDVTQEEGNYHP
jgi:hypothetical protein